MGDGSPREGYGHEDSDDDLDYYNYDEPDPYVEHESAFSDHSKVEAFKCQEMDVGAVEGLLNQEVETLCNAIQVPPSIARIFLLNHDWNVDLVKKGFVTNPLLWLVEQCLIPPTSVKSTISDSPDVMSCLQQARRLGYPIQRYLTPVNASDEICSICCTQPSRTKVEFFSADLSSSNESPTTESTVQPSGSSNNRSNLYGLSCGHRYCSDCWSSHLSIQVDKLASDIKCMGEPCRVSVPEDFLLALLKGSPMKDKYQKSIFHRMVSSHPLLRFCVGADCPVIIFALESPKARLIHCSNCHSRFCFACGGQYHAPADCETMKLWLAKCEDDSGTATYIAAHTKDCPECRVCIEKNGGCNHMVCTKCHHEFCWVCMDPWNTHRGSYNCSRYTSSEAMKDAHRNSAREALRRYVFYYDRWANHEQSLRLEKEHRAAVSARIHQKVLAKDGTWIDWQYLLTAAETLRNCRYTLKYTYPTAFFSEKLTNKDLFEYQQATLEAEVEDLAWKIERAEITDRASLQNAMDMCEKHRLTLLKQFLKD